MLTTQSIKSLVVLSLTALALSGCGNNPPQNYVDHSGFSGEAAPAKTEAQRAHLTKEINALQFGDSLQYVVSRLGKPTRRFVPTPKTYSEFEKVKNDIVMTYYFSQYVPGKDLGNTEAVDLEFDKNRKLYRIFSLVPGIESRHR